MTGRPGSQWSEEKLAQLRRLDAQGLSIREMAVSLGCAPSTVKRQREHCDLHRPSPIIKSDKPSGRGYVRKRVGKASTLPLLASLGDKEHG